MSAAPKAAHKNPAQVKASKAFAAGGRAAQARTRAAYKKAHGGKNPPRSKAQKSAARKWAAAGRAAQAAAKSGKKSPASRKKAALPTANIPAGPVLWLPGCINDRPVCYAVAVANHLLAATGVLATDADILALHNLAGGDNGATLDLALEAAHEHGLAGVKLATFDTADEIFPGMVVGVQTRRGYHAVLSHPVGLISWGLLMPRFGEPEEAWTLEWETTDELTWEVLDGQA